MIETCRSIFKSFNINNLSVCIGWCADQVTLRSARCNDKDNKLFVVRSKYMYIINKKLNILLRNLVSALISFYIYFLIHDKEDLHWKLSGVINSSSQKCKDNGASGSIKEYRTPLSVLCRAATLNTISKIVFLAFQISIWKSTAS